MAEIRKGLERFQFNPFWTVTRLGFLREYFGKINIGGDETHGSRFIIIPLVGTFILFDKYPCSDPECFHNEEDYDPDQYRSS